jgi:hypothetical protein
MSSYGEKKTEDGLTLKLSSQKDSGEPEKTR